MINKCLCLPLSENYTLTASITKTRQQKLTQTLKKALAKCHSGCELFKMIYLIVLHFRTVINLTLSNKKRPMSDSCHIYPDILQILITVKKWKLIRY